MSDHKPKLLIFKCHHKKFSSNNSKKKAPKIDADRLKIEGVANTYRGKIMDILKEEPVENIEESELVEDSEDMEDYLLSGTKRTLQLTTAIGMPGVS